MAIKRNRIHSINKYHINFQSYNTCFIQKNKWSMMKTHLFLLAILFSSTCMGGWGFFAHKKINRLAVFTIPEGELFQFYKHHMDFITEHAVDPDKRRYAVKGEAEKHYIDIDHFSPIGEDPFKIMPRKWNDAVNKFSKDTLLKYGISPWNIQWMLKKLTDAFKNKDLERILKYSAEIGHYIADAHVPLHSTENYNGQFTNQKGIHGFWESRVPELFFNEYDLITGKANYINFPLNDTWNTIEQSFRAVDSVLDFEKQLTLKWAEDRKYAYEKRGRITMKVYSRDFSNAYSDMLDGMQEKRIRASIKSIGSYWYTAWINAGQPNLTELYNNKSKIINLDEINEIENPKSNKVQIETRSHNN